MQETLNNIQRLYYLNIYKIIIKYYNLKIWTLKIKILESVLINFMNMVTKMNVYMFWCNKPLLNLQFYIISYLYNYNLIFFYIVILNYAH